MELNEALNLINQTLFIAIGAITILDYIRHRDRVRLDIALMFGALGLIVLIQVLGERAGVQSRLLGIVGGLGLLAQPHLSLRLVQHFRSVSKWIRYASLIGFALSGAAIAFLSQPLPQAITLGTVGYFVVVESYVALAFVKGGLSTRGVTLRRLFLAAIGSALLALDLLLIGVSVIYPTFGLRITTYLLLLGMLSGISYYLSFSTPRWLRRIWQLTELQIFLRESTRKMVAEEPAKALEYLRDTAVRAVGGLDAMILLRDADRQKFTPYAASGPFGALFDRVAQNESIQAMWQDQQPGVVQMQAPPTPSDIAASQDFISDHIFVVPIKTTDHSWGLLAVAMRYGSLFVDDDLSLLELLAQHGALILENRALIDNLERRVEDRTRELRESEERFRSAFEQAAVGIAHVAQDGQFLKVNQRLSDILGYATASELSALTAQEATHADDLEIDQEQLARLWNGQLSTYSIEKRFLHRNQSNVWVNVTASIVYGAVGNAQYLMWVVQDINDRKALEDLRDRLAAIVESSNDAIIGKTTSGKIVSWNAGAEKMYGYCADEMVGKPISTLFPPEVYERDFQLLERLIDGEHIEQYETVRLRKDGERIDVSLTLSPTKDENGCVTGVSAIARDITDRKRAAEALQQYSEELARSNTELQQFAYVASHDLQEPLRAVSGYVGLLKRRYQGQLDDRADEYIMHAVEGAQRMQVLIDDLLAYSRVGANDAGFEAVQCNELVSAVLNDLQLTIEENNAVITVDNLPCVMAAPTQLTQLFQNLISNAIKFRNDKAPEVHISAVSTENEWTFAVADNGIGIEADHLDRIFGLFQRLHLREEYPGTGLGLAICRKIVEYHGGRIWAEPAPGRGAIFRFTIPIRGQSVNERQAD